MARISSSVDDVGEEQVGVPGPEAAVAADVQVPALLGGDDAEVLAARLGALAGAAADRRLDLVRGAQPAVAQLELDGEPDRILYAVAAPGRADAALDRAQRLAVGVTGFEARVDQAPPDLRQLLHPRAEQVDALPAGDFRVEPEVAGDLADDDELLRGDLAAGDARHHRSRCRRAGCWRGSGRWCPAARPARRRGCSRCSCWPGSRRRPACRCRSRAPCRVRRSAVLKEVTCRAPG